MKYIGLFKWYDFEKEFGVISTLLPRKIRTAEVFIHHSKLNGVNPSNDGPIIFEVSKRTKGTSGYEAINCVQFSGTQEQWLLLFDNIEFNVWVNTKNGSKDVFIEAIKRIYGSKCANCFIEEYYNWYNESPELRKNRNLYFIEALGLSKIKEIQEFVRDLITRISFVEKKDLFIKGSLGLYALSEHECIDLSIYMSKSQYDSLLDSNTDLYLRIIEKKIQNHISSFKFDYKNSYSVISSIKNKNEYETLNELYEDYLLRANQEQIKTLCDSIENLIIEKESVFLKILNDLFLKKNNNVNSFVNEYRNIVAFPKCFNDRLKEYFNSIAINSIRQHYGFSNNIRLMSMGVIPVDEDYIVTNLNSINKDVIKDITKRDSVFSIEFSCFILFSYLELTIDILSVCQIYREREDFQREDLSEKLKTFINEVYRNEDVDFINYASEYIDLFGEDYIHSLSVSYLLVTHKTMPIFQQISRSNGNYKDRIISSLLTFHEMHSEIIDENFIEPFCSVYARSIIQRLDNNYIIQLIKCYIYNIKNYEKAIYYASKCSSEVRDIIEDYLISILSIPEYMKLWEASICNKLPDGYLDNYFDDKEVKYDKAIGWLKNNRLTKDTLIGVFNNTLSSIKDIKYHRYFKTRFLIYSFAKERNWTLEVSSIDDSEKEQFDWTLELSYKSFDSICKFFVLFPEKYQIKIFKFIFLNIAQHQIKITVDELRKLCVCSSEYLSYNIEDKPILSLSVSVIIETLCSYEKNNTFITDKDFYSLVYKSVNNGYDELTLIGSFFDKCTGKKKRFYPNPEEVTKFIYPLLDISGKRWYIINFQYDSYLIEKTKNIPGRIYHPQYQIWMVPDSSYENIKDFAKNEKFVFLSQNVKADCLGQNFSYILNNYDKKKFKEDARDVTELKDWQEDMPSIRWCEGRESQNAGDDDTWWCVGHNPCNACAIRLHDQSEWEEYTLLDFFNIMGFSIYETNKYGNFKTGKYALFITSINRFNNLLERLKCSECGQILYPIDSNYSVVGTTTFCCSNKKCSKYISQEKIYLNHCYARRCRGVIDSRDSQRCPHKLVICPSCGTCCSTEMFRTRLSKLRQTGADHMLIANGYRRIIDDLVYKVENNKGHQDNNEYFCFNCGTRIYGDINQTICNNCNTKIKYRTF